MAHSPTYASNIQGLQTGIEGLGELCDTRVVRRRRDHAKISRVSERELNEALRSPRGYGYGQSGWKPGKPLTFEQRRDIIRTRLQVGFPDIQNFADRVEPLTGEEERTTLAAFLTAEKERESSRNAAYPSADLYNEHVLKRELVLAGEAQARHDLYPVPLAVRMDVFRPQLGAELRPNLHLCRFYRIYDAEDIVVICNVRYVPPLPPLPISKRLRDDGYFGYHEEVRYPQMHEPGRYHMALCPGIATVHVDLRSDLAWYRPDLAAHFVEEREGRFAASGPLKAAIRRLCRLEKETYDRIVHTVLGAPQQAAYMMQFAANYLCTHLMDRAQVLEVFAQFQRGVLEVRAWNAYDNALARTRWLARKLSRRERWHRAAPQNEINTDYRGVFVTDFATANIYGHLQAPTWVLRGRSQELVDLLKRQGLQELQPSALHDLPIPELRLMRQTTPTAYGHSLYEDAPEDTDFGDSHESHTVQVDESLVPSLASAPSRQPARPVADQSARSLASAHRRSPVRAARARNLSPARNTSRTRTWSHTRDASPVRHAAHAHDSPGPPPLQAGGNKRRAQEQAEGHRSKRHQQTQLYKADYWREQQGLETKETPSWFPVATRWPAVAPVVDESTARMDRLCMDAHAPVRFVKSKLRFRTPRPSLFINKKDDQVVFSTWIIIRPFTLKMLVSRSIAAMPGLQREQWRSLVKLTLGTHVARSLYAVLGLDGFVDTGGEHPAAGEEVQDRTVRGSDLIDLEPVDEALVAIVPAHEPSSDAMDTDQSPAQPSLAVPQQTVGPVDRMLGSRGDSMHGGSGPRSARVARRPAFHKLYEDPSMLPCDDGDDGDYDSDTSISSDRSKRSVAYGVKEIVPYLTEKLTHGEAPLRGEEERYQAEPCDWHDARTHLRYFYEAESSLLQEFDKSHHDYEKIARSLQCWFDYENRRILYLTSNLRLDENKVLIPTGEQLLVADKFTFVSMQGSELPDTFSSRRIWPYRATPAERPAVDHSPQVVDHSPVIGQPVETTMRGTTVTAPPTVRLPWVDEDHALELARLVLRLSSSTKTFDEHPLKPWDDPNWLTDDLRAYIVWELREIEFRNGLYTIDFVLRAAHPHLDLAKIDPAQRTAQLHACWGGGDMKPDAASPSPYSLPETSPELLQALTAMLDFMAAWPRADQHLRRPATPWKLEQVDGLASMVFGFYAQTYFDYIRCSAPLPVLRPPLPW